MEKARSYWYVATLIIRCKIERKSISNTCEEQVRLIRAVNADEAYEKALLLGKKGEHSYENMYDEMVFWEFVGLENLEELDDLSIRDGVEIRSRFFGHKDPHDLVCPKEKLSIFLSSQNEDRPEYRIINENEPEDE